MKIKIKALVTALFITIIAISSTENVNAQLLSMDNPSAVQYYSMVPLNIRAGIEANGVNILVDTNSLSAYDANPRVLGITNVRVCNGRIINQAIFVRNGNESTILHEVGHVVNNSCKTYCYWSKTPQWNTIYASEVQNAVVAGMSDSNLYNANEYFAEAFMLYVLNPNSLATYCPMTYQFMVAAIQMYQ